MVCDDDKTTYEICLVIVRECENGEYSCHSTTQPVGVIHRPKANFDIDNQVCIGEENLFSNLSCNASEFEWDFGGSGTSTAENASHTFNQTGLFSVCLTAKNECTEDQLCKNVRVVQEPIADFDYGFQSGGNNCAPATIAFTNQTDIGNSAVTWSFTLDGDVLGIEDSSIWQFTDTLMTVNTPDIEVIFFTPGEYEITQKASNACGTHETTEIITIISQPNLSLEEVDDQCEFPFVYEPNFDDTGDIATYNWQFPGGNPSSSNSATPPDVTYDSPGTYTVEVTISNTCGDQTITDNFIIVDPNSGANLPDTTLCLNAPNLDLDDEILNGNWDGPGVNNSDIFNPSASDAGVGTHTLSYTEQIGSCTLEGDLDITVKPLPTIEAGGDFSACVENGNFSLPTASPANGVWTNEQNDTISTELNPIDLGIGNHTFTYSYTDPDTECPNSDQITIEVFDIQINLDDIETNYCDIDEDFNLQANVNVSSTGQWSSNENSVTADGIFNPTLIPIDPDTNTGTDVLTYTVTHQGCTDSQQITVSVIVAEQINAGQDISVCPDAPPIALTDGFPSGGNWFLNGNSVTEFTPSANNVGPNVLTYIVGSGNCEQSDTKTITVHPVANISLNAPSPICLNESPHQFSATPTGGTWSGDHITASGSFDPSSVGAGSFEVTYTFVDDKGCEFSASKTIEVEGIPAFDAPIADEACVGDEVAFVLEGEGLACTWIFSDGVTLNSCNETRTFNAEATYNVTLQVETPLGCTDQLVQDIFIAEPPMANFTQDAPNDFVCTPLPVNIQNMSSGYNAIYTFDFGNGDSLVTSNPDTLFTYIYEGAYIVSDTTFNLVLTVENPCGTDTFVQEVKTKPSPQVLFGPEALEVCSGSPLSFNSYIIGNPDSVFWDFGDGTTSTNPEEFTHTYTAINNDTTIYTVTLIAENECNSDTASWDILVKPKTVTAFFNRDPLSGCVPLTVQFQDLSTEGINRIWNFDDGNTSNEPTPTHTFEEAGTYNVMLAVDNGCSSDTIYHEIEVFPAPQIESFNVPPLPCIDEPTPFEAIVNEEISSYLWHFGDGDSSTLTNPMHTYTETGEYEVTLTIVSAFNECSNTFTTLVEVIDKPVAEIAANNSFGCSPLTVDFQNLSENAVAYQWDFGDGNTSVLFEPSHPFISTVDTTFVVTLVAFNSEGCKDSTQFLVPVTAQPIAAFVASEYGHCDAPAAIELTNQSIGGTTYEWSVNGELEASSENTNVLLPNIGDYLVELLVTNPFGCEDRADTTIRVVPQASAALTAESFKACEGESIRFENASIGTHFLWDFGDGTTSTDENPIHEYETEGTYNISLIASFDGFCADTLRLQNAVTVSQSPTADFDYISQTEPVADCSVEFINLSAQEQFWYWSFGNGDSSTEENPIYRFYENGVQQVTLIVENAIGCRDTISKAVEFPVCTGFFAPNIFMPDELIIGANTVQPKGVGLADFHIRIFAENGNLVWESEELRNGQPVLEWDGTFEGKPLPQGAYAWWAEYVFINDIPQNGTVENTPKRSETGTITLIRGR